MINAYMSKSGRIIEVVRADGSVDVFAINYTDDSAQAKEIMRNKSEREHYFKINGFKKI